MHLIASSFSDFLGNVWFAGLCAAVAFVGGWIVAKKYGSKF